MYVCPDHPETIFLISGEFILHTEFHSYSGKDIRSRKRGHNDYGQSWMVASALEEGPKTIEELAGLFIVAGLGA